VRVTNSCGAINSNNSIIVTILAGAPATPGSISGPATVCANQQGVGYSINIVANASSYNWTVPQNATIASGQGTTSITVNFGNSAGNIKVQAVNSCGSGPFVTKKVNKVNCRFASPIDEAVAESMNVFPNPASENIYITLGGSENKKYELNLLNVTGQVMIHDTGYLQSDDQTLVVDVKDLPGGIYFVSMQFGEDRVVRKVVVQ
jgi:hypothetical protein